MRRGAEHSNAPASTVSPLWDRPNDGDATGIEEAKGRSLVRGGSGSLFGIGSTPMWITRLSAGALAHGRDRREPDADQRREVRYGFVRRECPCTSSPPRCKSPPDRGVPQSEGPFSAGGIRFVWFDTALARGPIDFPYPCRYGPGSGASEFVEATVAASDPATDPSRRTPDGRFSVGVPSENVTSEIDRSFGRRANLHLSDRCVNRELFPNPPASGAPTLGTLLVMLPSLPY